MNHREESGATGVRLDDRARAIAEANARAAEMLVRLEELNKELKRAKEKAETYLNLVSTIVVALDRRGNVAQLNRKGLEILGCTESELLGKNWFETSLPAAQRAAARAAFERLLSPDGVPESDYESGVVTRSAADRTIAWHYITLKDEAGRVIGALGSGEDVTERKRAQQAIEEINERLEKLVQARTAELSRANDSLQVEVNQRKQSEEAVRRSQEETERILDSIWAGIMVVDARDHTILYANPFALQMFDRPRDEILGQLCHGFVCPAEQGKCPVTDLGQKVDASERKLIRRDGSRVPILKTVTQVIRSGRECLIESFLDLTERKQAEATVEARSKELARSNAELQNFAYIASHDLQEPLRMVASYTQLLARRYQGKLDEKADKFIAYAVDGAARMQNLINDLLSYARVETRGHEPAPTDCREVLRQAEENLQLAITETGAEVSADALPEVSADGAQLVQLFQNLIANAIKFHGEARPRVHLSAVRNNGDWLFSVQDNGIGIPPEHAERVFQIFQRLHGRTEYPGTGIGLAVCKKIVERHGGRIWVESESGCGATFKFTIPEKGANQ